MMIQNNIILLLIRVTLCLEQGLTPNYPEHADEMDNIGVAAFGDAQHRGYKFYHDSSSGHGSSESETHSSDHSSSVSSESSQSSTSSEASSKETKERIRKSKVYRTCTPCPQDMLKRHTNRGINWICGGYQRARRTFKSECMMRYRNCQDGTMFVKLYDFKCRNDTYHGRHWFYDYRVKF